MIYLANIRIPTEKAHGFQIMKMAEAFSKAGINLELVLPTKKNQEFKGIDPFNHYQVKNNFQLIHIFCFDPDWLIKPFSGIYIKFQIFFFSVSLFFYLLFKKDKEDYIFYTRDEYLLPLLQLFTKKMIWEGHSLPRNKKYYLKYFKRCHKITVLTKQLKNNLIELGIEADKILVTPDAVDLKTFDLDLSKEEARKKLGLPQNKIILGYTGTFETKNMDKGISDIFQALKIINQTEQNLIFVAVGGSVDEIKRYQALAKKEQVTNILLLEKVDQQKLAIYQKAFDILLMPFPDQTHYRYYMSPMKMFEYMAATRPIIASDLPSIREILNESNCLFCKPDDPKDLADKIRLILQSQALNDKIVKQAYQDVLQYTWQNRAKRIIESIN